MEEEGYDADTESDIESARQESLSGHGSIARHASYQHRLNVDASHYRSMAAEEIKILFPDVITFVLHSINRILPDLLVSNNCLRYVLISVSNPDISDIRIIEHF